MTRFLLLRHASHDLLNRALAGCAPGIHLSEQGRQEAERLAGRLVDEHVDFLYASPLERTRETAAVIGQRLGIPVRIDEGLREMDFGEWTGRTFEELEHLPQWDAFHRSRSTTDVPGGERMLAVQSRVVACLARLRHVHPDSTVAVVSHGDVLRAAIAAHLGLSLDFIHRFAINPATITTLRVSEHGSNLVGLNQPPEPRARRPIRATRVLQSSVSKHRKQGPNG